MKIEVIAAAEVGTSSRAKYAEIYTQLDALPADKGLKLTFDTKEDMQRFKSAWGSRYEKAEWRYVPDFGKFTVAITRAAVPVVPDGPKPYTS